MKEIFVGSSTEGLAQAIQVVAVLAEAKDVKPLLWTECFKLGDITFMGIEDVARRVDEPGILRGNFSSEVGGNIYSQATGKCYR